MKNYPKHIKNTLYAAIRDMAKHPQDFCCNPEKDFTRRRKLPFGKILTLLVKMGGHSLRDEMLDCLDFEEMPASVSALVQQRSKILPETLEYLFREFTDRCQKPKLYKGYRLLAVDGSDLQFTANPNDPYFEFLPKGSSDFYPISFRIVRFQISEDSTETLITSLDQNPFPAEELKRIYHLRWGIETSFRQLKYTVGLSLF